MRDLTRYQADYHASYGFERHMVRYRRRQVLDRLGRYPRQHVVEVGCGLEPLFEHATGWSTWTVVEPAPEFAAHARTRAAGHDGVRVIESAFEDAAGTLGAGADVIVLSSLLHEVREPETLLAAARACCRAEGIVHVNVPNARSLHNRLAVHMGLIPDLFTRSPLAEQLQRTTTWDVASLRTFVEARGFHVVASGTYFLKPFSNAQLLGMLEAGLITESVLDALDAVNGDFDEAGAELYLDARPA